MKYLAILTALCWMLISAGTLRAEGFTSPDGHVSFEFPVYWNVERLHLGLENKAIVGWETEDKLVQILFYQFPDLAVSDTAQDLAQRWLKEDPARQQAWRKERVVNDQKVFSLGWTMKDPKEFGQVDAYVFGGKGYLLVVMGKDQGRQMTVARYLFESMQIKNVSKVSQVGSQLPSTTQNQWTSPDGILSLDLPTQGLFLPVAGISAPTVGDWKAFFGERRLLVRLWPAPPSGKYTQREMEAATLKSVPGGEVISTTSRVINGYKVYDISFRSKTLGQFGQMTVFIVNKTVYTIGAKGAVEIDKDPILASVYQSIRISGPPGPDDPKIAAAYRMGYIASQIFVYGLMGALLLWGIRKAVRSGKTPPPLPPAPEA